MESEIPFSTAIYHSLSRCEHVGTPVCLHRVTSFKHNFGDTGWQCLFYECFWSGHCGEICTQIFLLSSHNVCILVMIRQNEPLQNLYHKKKSAVTHSSCPYGPLISSCLWQFDSLSVWFNITLWTCQFGDAVKAGGTWNKVMLLKLCAFPHSRKIQITIWFSVGQCKLYNQSV